VGAFQNAFQFRSHFVPFRSERVRFCVSNQLERVRECGPERVPITFVVKSATTGIFYGSTSTGVISCVHNSSEMAKLSQYGRRRLVSLRASGVKITK
jgi:hypothetical protein